MNEFYVFEYEGLKLSDYRGLVFQAVSQVILVVEEGRLKAGVDAPLRLRGKKLPKERSREV